MLRFIVDALVLAMTFAGGAFVAVAVEEVLWVRKLVRLGYSKTRAWEILRQLEIE